MSNKFVPGRQIQNKKTLQTPVIVGWGEKQELVVKESVISPPSPPIFRIVGEPDKQVVITQTKLVPTVIVNSLLNTGGTADGTTTWWGKVIINGYIDKNVNYKTITDFDTEAVNGPLYQYTTRVEFATFVEVSATEPLVDTDKVEILTAIVEGEKEDLLDPNPVAAGAPSWAVTYNRLLEKMIVQITLKVVRIEDVPVAVDC